MITCPLCNTEVHNSVDQKLVPDNSANPNHPTIYCKSVVTLHRVMKGITPQNIHDKIQTLLVFS